MISYQEVIRRIDDEISTFNDVQMDYEQSAGCWITSSYILQESRDVSINLVDIINHLKPGNVRKIVSKEIPKNVLEQAIEHAELEINIGPQTNIFSLYSFAIYGTEYTMEMEAKDFSVDLRKALEGLSEFEKARVKRQFLDISDNILKVLLGKEILTLVSTYDCTPEWLLPEGVAERLTKGTLKLLGLGENS